MVPTLPARGLFAQLALTLRQGLARWWHGVRLVALLGALVLAPSSHASARRGELARHVYQDTAPTLPGFLVLSTLIAVVLIRIVVVTAQSYGLTQYALETVVRVLVLELIPLTAALYAALRCSFPNAAEIATLRRRDGWGGTADLEPLRREVVPRLLANLFCALLLAALACVVTLVIAYLSVYGFTTAGLPAYTHTVGQIFAPAVSLVFALKALFLSLAVAFMPVAAAVEARPAPRRSRTSPELGGLVRMLLVILLIEAASLAGNYA